MYVHVYIMRYMLSDVLHTYIVPVSTCTCIYMYMHVYSLSESVTVCLFSKHGNGIIIPKDSTCADHTSP